MTICKLLNKNTEPGTRSQTLNIIKMKQLYSKIGNKDGIFALLGHLCFFVLLAASVYFYKERIIFADSAFQFFKIVNFEKINVEAYRYGAILPELPLLLAMKLGLSLKLLLITYSVAFIALYYLVFFVCTRFLKNTPVALSVVFALVLCIRESFYYPVTETQQCLVFSVLLFAILQYPSFRNSFVQLLLALLVILLAFFTHPVALYTLTFLIGYNAIDKKQLRTIQPYILILAVAGLAFVKVILTNENSYEGKFFAELLQSPSIILNLSGTYSKHFFFDRINGLFLGVVVFEFILVLYLLFKKEYLKLLWQSGFTFIFLIVTLLAYNKGDSNILMERAFMPLALLTSVPLMKEMLENNRRYQLSKVIFLLIIIFACFNRIGKQGVSYRERIRFNQELMAKTAKFPNRKFIANNKDLEKHYNTFWSYSFETLLLSAITANIPTQTIYPANDVAQLAKYTNNTNSIFLGAEFWLEWNIGNLNPKYFDLPKETAYVVIKIDEL